MRPAFAGGPDGINYDYEATIKLRPLTYYSLQMILLSHYYTTTNIVLMLIKL